jgi:predicted O-methyltransferase YrrM
VNDLDPVSAPAALDAICRDTDRIGFAMASEPRTGSLLRALAASKPGGRVLELGTGTGVGTAWLLDGMDSTSRLQTVDCDPAAQEIARRHLGGDPRVTFHLADGAEFLLTTAPASFDLIYADAWPGKFTDLETALSRLRPGGIYVIDDLLPQPNWPADHGPKVAMLVESLDRRDGFAATKLAWATGLMLVVRR